MLLSPNRSLFFAFPLLWACGTSDAPQASAPTPISPARDAAPPAGDAGAPPDANDAGAPPDASDAGDASSICVIHASTTPLAVDPSFGGLVGIPIEGTLFDRALGARLTPKGDIVVYAPTEKGIYFSRLGANGKLDTTFGSKGALLADGILNLSWSVISWDVDAEGRIVLADLLPDGTPVLRRYTEHGIDTTFGADGTGTVNLRPSLETADQMALAGDTILVMGGYSVKRIARYSAQGALIGTPFTPPNMMPFAGTSTTAYVDSVGGIGAIGVDGKPVESFGVNGVAPTSSVASDIWIDADGSLFVSTQTLVHLTPNGARDPAFGTNGVVDFGEWARAAGFRKRCDGVGVVFLATEIGLEIATIGAAPSTPVAFPKWPTIDYAAPIGDAVVFDPQTGAFLEMRPSSTPATIEIRRLLP